MWMLLPPCARRHKQRRGNGELVLGIFGRGIHADKDSGDSEDSKGVVAKRA